MSRTRRSPTEVFVHALEPEHQSCRVCGEAAWVAYHTKRTLTRLDGTYQLILTIRRCRNQSCSQFHQPYRPEEEGAWALPHGEFGLDIIVLIGTLRYVHHRSIPEIHQELSQRGVRIAERSVTNLLARYEELVTLHLTDQTRLHEILIAQGQVILARDGLQPDVGHEVLWVLRDVILPDIPHQLCHFHYLREAAKPVYEADRHAKKELKKYIRGIRPIERSIEPGEGAEAEVIHGYCLAVRSVLTDDGRLPLNAPGLKLHERVSLIVASLARLAKRGAYRAS